MTPVISNLSGDRTNPSESFECCQVDLSGPIKVMTPGSKTRRSEPDKPVWLSVFVCLYTKAVFVDTIESYWTDLMLLSMRKLAATYRFPRRIISDSSTQLVAARTLLMRHFSEEDFTWIVCPPQAHNFVGGAELMISLINGQLKKKLDGAHLTIMS